MAELIRKTKTGWMHLQYGCTFGVDALAVSIYFRENTSSTFSASLHWMSMVSTNIPDPVMYTT